jgi:[ribosomal protein S5]-alanine N-acetyltransferase
MRPASFVRSRRIAGGVLAAPRDLFTHPAFRLRNLEFTMAVRPERNWDTPRLFARPATVADAQVVFAEYASDPLVARYMTWTPHRSVDDTAEFLARCEHVWDDGSAYPWGLWRKQDGAFAGLLEIRVTPTAVDLGYALVQRAWHQGLMTEALKPVVQWALAQPTIYRAWATCDVANGASARVLERVGMAREGVLRRWLMHPNVSDTPRDCFCYSIVK